MRAHGVTRFCRRSSQRRSISSSGAPGRWWQADARRSWAFTWRAVHLARGRCARRAPARGHGAGVDRRLQAAPGRGRRPHPSGHGRARGAGRAAAHRAPARVGRPRGHRPHGGERRSRCATRYAPARRSRPTSATGARRCCPRHPNFIWEQLAADELTASLIVDGHHLPPATVKSMVRAKTARAGRAGDRRDGRRRPAARRVPAGRADGAARRERARRGPGPAEPGRVCPVAGPRVGNTVRFAGVTLEDALAMASTQPGRVPRRQAGRLTELEWDAETGTLRVSKVIDSHSLGHWHWWSLVVGHWQSRWSLVVGYWSLVIGHWSLVTVIGRWSLVVGHGRWSLVGGLGRWSVATVDEPVRNSVCEA